MGYRCPSQHLTTLHGSREYLDLENNVRAGVTVGKGNECDPVNKLGPFKPVQCTVVTSKSESVVGTCYMLYFPFP